MQIIWRFARITFYRVDNRIRTLQLQTKRHRVEHYSKVHRTRSGQECAPSHRPAKIRSTGNPTTRRLPREVQQLRTTHSQIHNPRPNKCPTPQLLTEQKKYNIINYPKLRTRLHKNTRAQPRPNYFHSWTRGSLVTSTAKIRSPQNKAHSIPHNANTYTPAAHNLRTQHQTNALPPQTHRSREASRVHTGRSKVSRFDRGPIHARGQDTRVVKHAEREAVDRRVGDDTV